MVQKREDDLRLDPLSGIDSWQKLKQDATNAVEGTGGKNTKSFRRVHLQGTFQHSKQILIGPRGPPPGALAESGPNSGRGGGGGMSSSTQGYWVVTPFVVSNGDESDKTIRSATSDGQVIEDSQPKRGWFGRLLGKKSKPTESSTPIVDAETNTSPEKTESNKEETIVWVNRGWIPRQYIDRHSTIITSWNQPLGTVELMAMESNTETPGTFSPPSRLDSKTGTSTQNEQTINKLLWLDRTAMEEMIACENDCHPPLFVEINTNEQGSAPQFPVKPARKYVGEFKVTPEVHAGYAFTWFGLSGAGMIMTRKLLTRGR